jgi:hydrogenase maturation protease
MTMARRRWLVLGLGNPLAGDDAFGPAVVAALGRHAGIHAIADVREAGTDLLGEFETLGHYEDVILVDAVIGGGREGEVAVVEEAVFAGWPDASPGGHSVSPLVAVKLFRRLRPEARTRIRLVALHADELRVGSERAGGWPEAVEMGVAAVVAFVTGQTPASPFQACGSCRASWTTWHAFAADPRVRLLGLQAVPGLPDANLLVFEHACGSSVSILTKRLRFLLPEDDPRAEWPSLRDTPECPRHCRSLADLEACERPCRNARDRELIKLVQRLRQPAAVVATGSAATPA